MKKKKLIISCILSLIMCASLLTGATYALFTSEDTTNIAITSGEIDVKANIENLVLTSPTAIDASGNVTDDTNAAIGGRFANGGTAAINGDTLTISNIMPGDKATFDIRITNKSNVIVQYRTKTSVNQNDGLFESLDVRIGSSYDGSLQYSEWDTLVVGSQDEVINCSVELPTTAQSVYMGKTCAITFIVEAVQGNTVVENPTVVNSDSEFVAAINDGEDYLALKNGNYKLFASESVDLSGKEIVLVGSEETVIDFTTLGVNYMQILRNSTITFDGMTIKWAVANNNSYQGLANASKIVYKNCYITGCQFMYSDAEFINCTFENYSDYCVYGRGRDTLSTLTFTDCTFKTGGKAIMLYSDHATKVNVVANNCTFNGDGSLATDKAAIETGDNLNAPANTSEFNITIINCTASGFASNNSTSNLWGNKNSIPSDRLNVVIGGVDVY